MPRSISGVYTLPEPAFVAGTVIQSSPVNNDFSDIATALTESLATTGVSTMTGPIKAAAGSVTAPSITFATAQGTGFYLSGANEITWTANGVAAAVFSASGTVTWIGAQTFQAAVTFSAATTFSGVVTADAGLNAVSPTVPFTSRNSTNDTNPNLVARFFLGSGAGNSYSIYATGSGANDVSSITHAIAGTNIYVVGSTFNILKNLSVDAGIITLTTSGYIDQLEVSASVAAPAANTIRTYARDTGTVPGWFYKDEAGKEYPIAPIGMVIGRNYAEITTAVTCTVVTPLDNTIPQSGEATQVLQISYTAKYSTSKLRFTINGFGSQNLASGDGYLIWSFFKDAGADAIAAGVVGDDPAAAYMFPINAVFEISAGDTSAHTYTLKVGANPNSNTTINGGFTGTVLFGGVARTSIVVEEIFQ